MTSPMWLLVNLFMTVGAFEDGKFWAVANWSEGNFTEESTADRLQALGATVGPADYDVVPYGLVSESPAGTVVIGVADAQPRDVGLLIRFNLIEGEHDNFDTEVFEIDWADSLFDRTGVERLTAMTPRARAARERKGT